MLVYIRNFSILMRLHTNGLLELTKGRLLGDTNVGFSPKGLRVQVPLGMKSTQSVGLLSYTFLLGTGQDDVIVPMIDFDISKHWAEPILYGTQDD
ncbi:hypothetical protein Tco_0794141 [Tanacetum coccineum]